MLIQEATNSDIQEINALYYGLHPQEYDLTKPVTDIYRATVVPTTFIVKEKDVIVGFLLLLVITYWDYTYAEIQELFVVPNVRRRGFGSNLIKKAVDCAKSSKARVVIVSTDRENVGARALYTRSGFTETTSGHFKLLL